MKTTSRIATRSSAHLPETKSTIRSRVRAIALLSVAGFCVAPLPAWATRTVTLNNMQSGCGGTLEISGDGWGKWSKKKPDKITISVQNSSALPVQGVIAHTTAEAEKFSISIHYTVISPCSNDCSTQSTVRITAKGQKGNTASKTINLPGLYCGVTWAP